MIDWHVTEPRIPLGRGGWEVVDWKPHYANTVGKQLTRLARQESDNWARVSSALRMINERKIADEVNIKNLTEAMVKAIEAHAGVANLAKRQTSLTRRVRRLER